jgi:hypothetical protein
MDWMDDAVISKIERIGSQVFDLFRAGEITFDVCEASLTSLTNATGGQVWLGIPEEA